MSVERNKHVALHCQAQGVPTPTIVWKKATGEKFILRKVKSQNQLDSLELPFFEMKKKTGSKSGEYEELRERAYTKILSNGTLLLQHVKEDREGFYLCQASNGIGSGIGKVVQLKVNCKYFHICDRNRMVAKRAATFPSNFSFYPIQQHLRISPRHRDWSP